MTNQTEVATLRAKFEADTGDFTKGAKTVQAGLGSIANIAKGVGSILAGMIPAALFGAAIKEASEMQSELAQLDAVLKSTSQGMKAASTTTAGWKTVTTGATAQTAEWQKELTSAQNALGKLQAKQAAGIELSKAEIDRMGKLQGEVAAYGQAIKGAVSTKQVWVNATAASADTIHMERQAYIDLASAMQKTTRFSDDQVMAAENMLLTFTKIGKDIFPKATEAVLDIATAMKTDAKSAAIQLGKALNNPREGITALTRVGVTFSEQQKRQINYFTATNQLAKAQAIILAELATEFGGSAEAAGKTFAGSLDRLKNSALDLAETVGMAILPTLQKFIDLGIELVGGIQQIDPGLVTLAAGFGLVAVAAGPIGGILTAILSPIGLVVAAVVGIKAAFENNLGGITTFVQGIVTGISGALGDIRNAIEGVFATATGNAPYGAAPSGDEISRSMQTQRTGPKTADIQKSVLPTKTRGSDFGSRISQVIDEALPQVKAAIDRLGLAIKNTLIEKLGISPELQATIERFFSPLTEGFKNLATINWGNVGIAGVAIAAFAIGVKGVGLAFSLFKSMVIFELFTVVLQQISSFVDAVKIGDVGGALKSFAFGVGALGIALAIGKIGILGSVVTGLVSVAGIGTGLTAVASGLAAMAIPILAIAAASVAFVAVMDALSKLGAPNTPDIKGNMKSAAKGGSITPITTSMNSGLRAQTMQEELTRHTPTGNYGVPSVVTGSPALEKLGNTGVGADNIMKQLATVGIPPDFTLKDLYNNGLVSDATMKALQQQGVLPSTEIRSLISLGLMPSASLTQLLRTIHVTIDMPTGSTGHTQAPTRDIGGPVSAGGLYKIGVPEMLQMGGNSYLMAPKSGYVTPMQSARGGGGGNTTIVNVNGQFSLEMIDNELRRRNLAPLGGRS